MSNIENQIEEWRDVPYFSGQYQVSNLGRVKSIERRKVTRTGRRILIKEKILKQHLSLGYPVVKLMKGDDGFSMKVHRLIAEAFIPNPENKPYINHKDGSRDNNSLDNLEWCTASENTKHAYNIGAMNGQNGEKNGFSKLNKIQVRTIKSLLSKGDLSHRKIAEMFGVCKSTITAINTNKNWNHI